MRGDGRGPHELRPVRYETGYLQWAEGSVLFEQGHTRVLVAASLEDQVPRFLQGTGRGWVTGEYAMLPRATQERTPREVGKGRPSGRTQEIQRLIGRSLRAITRMDRLGERTIWVDCDVLQADGGTRTAAITAGFIALSLALGSMKEQDLVRDTDVLADSVAAVSVGIVDGEPVLDLDYEEDARASVDANFVMTGSGRLVEIQGTGEKDTFGREDLDAMLDLAADGIGRLTAIQREAAGA